MTDISAGGEAIVLTFWHCAPGAKGQFMFRTLFPQTFKFPDIIKQSLRQGQVHVKEAMLYSIRRFVSMHIYVRETICVRLQFSQ